MNDPEESQALEPDPAVEPGHRTLGLVGLLIALALLAWYFWTSFESAIIPTTGDEKMLTQHDELFGVVFPDQTQGWVVGKFGLILHTSDGGKTWNRQSSHTSFALSAVSFADDLHGFAVGSAGTVVATVDGGRSWKVQRSEIREQLAPLGGQLGESWKERRSEIREQLLSVQALSPEVVFAAGAFGTLISTTDGGATWRQHDFSWEGLIPQIVKEVGLMEPALNSVLFVDRQSGWIVGEFGLILHTADGGRTWTTQRHGAELPQLYGIAFSDSRNGWVVGQKGSVLVTSDGGEHWRPVDVGVGNHLYAIAFKGKQGMIVGDGVALASNDAGASWSRVEPFPEDLWLSSLAIRGSGVVGVGRAGTIRNFE